MTSNAFHLVIDGSDEGWISAPRIPVQGDCFEVGDLTYEVAEVRWKILSGGRFAEAYVRADATYIPPAFRDGHSENSQQVGSGR